MACSPGAAIAQFYDFLRDARTPGRFRLFLRSLEPWYDWGTYGIIRVDGEGEGDAKFFAIDFLGIHLMIVIGRTPAKSGGAA